MPIGKRSGVHRTVERAPAPVAEVLRVCFGLDVAAEVRVVGLALEADQVVGEQRPDQPVVPRNGREDQRRRQRNVQEEADPVSAAQRAQLRGQRDQVVVVHPDDVVVAQQRLELAGEDLVHAPVTRDVARVEIGQVQPVMKHRPQHAVRIAHVKGLVVGPTEVDRHQLHGAGLLRAQFTLPIGAARRVFDDLSAPAEPEAAGVAQHVAQRDGQPARGGLARIGNAVGDDDEPAHGIPRRVRGDVAGSLISPCPKARKDGPRR